MLLGLAIWSSEFEWAYRLRQRFKAEIKKFRGWPTGKKVAFWIIFFAVCASFGYTYLLVLGPPFWVPDVGANLLEHLPGVEAELAPFDERRAGMTACARMRTPTSTPTSSPSHIAAALSTHPTCTGRTAGTRSPRPSRSATATWRPTST